MGHALQLLDRGVQPPDHAREALLALSGRKLELFGEIPDVTAGHEMSACAPDDDATQTRVGRQRSGVRDQRIHHRRIERVERGRTIERQRGDEAIAGKQDGTGHDKCGRASVTGDCRSEAGSLAGRRSVVRCLRFQVPQAF